MPEPTVRDRFESALRESSPDSALNKLAHELKREGMSQLDVYRLYDEFRAKLEHEDSPRYDAILDNMDSIVGWGRRANWLFDQKLDRTLYDKAFMKNEGETPIMNTTAKNTRVTVIPCLRYRNAPAAIQWLCGTFGFERHLVVPGEGDRIAQAQLSFGNGMIMLGSVAENEFGRLMKQPDEIGGAETQSSYVVVADADAVYARAKSVGAEIVMAIKDEDYGGRGFSCRDLEGHLWSFGAYDPWAAHTS
ncbi:MAG: glyoxalase/Bleomycin resistance/Dioxygenase superfamily protein [Pedosphaera sp.]|nr:glyoxalase/Bleomycin resistance/Dioxygenase superfamily protein [Pedosphaera sp.]